MLILLFFNPLDPCPPENIWVEEPEAGNCSVVWDEVPLVEYYMAFIKRDDGTEKSCNTTETTCPFFCMCGYTYHTTVFPYNQAGSSPHAHVRNYTTSRPGSTHINNTTTSACLCYHVKDHAEVHYRAIASHVLAAAFHWHMKMKLQTENLQSQ